MKIMIIGSSGAGKSTLTRKLSDLTDFPVLHLDKIWHSTDYSESAREILREKVQELWICESHKLMKFFGSKFRVTKQFFASSNVQLATEFSTIVQICRQILSKSLTKNI